MSRMSFINDLEFIKYTYILANVKLNSTSDVYIKPVCGKH
jgi:hypothetical protein